MGPEKRDHPGVDKNTFIPILIPEGLSDGRHETCRNLPERRYGAGYCGLSGRWIF
jgi:hypothetical protein